MVGRRWPFFMVVVLGMSLPASALADQWAWTYGGVSRDEARSVRQTADGGPILAGRIESFVVQ